MGQRSSIAKLPGAAQEKLRGMYAAGLTLDDILASLTDFLQTLDGEWKAPSRSAIHRDRVGYEATAARLREAREMATALATELGELAEDKTGQLMVDLMRTITFRLLQRNVDEDEPFDPKDLHFLARSLKDVASASAIGVKQAEDVKRAAREAAASAVEKVGKSRGLDGETIAAFYQAAKGV